MKIFKIIQLEANIDTEYDINTSREDNSVSESYFTKRSSINVQMHTNIIQAIGTYTIPVYTQTFRKIDALEKIHEVKTTDFQNRTKLLWWRTTLW